jgi:hypothetical protein
MRPRHAQIKMKIFPFSHSDGSYDLGIGLNKIFCYMIYCFSFAKFRVDIIRRFTFFYYCKRVPLRK